MVSKTISLKEGAKAEAKGSPKTIKQTVYAFVFKNSD